MDIYECDECGASGKIDEVGKVCPWCGEGMVREVEESEGKPASKKEKPWEWDSGFAGG